MSRITKRFAALKAEGRAGLVAYFSAGDPDVATSSAILKGMPAAGADLIELGMPFTDPMADGPVIQRASERALAHGVSLKQVIDFTKEFRKTNQATPVVLMGYANPIEAMGAAAFADAAKAAGVDGVLVVDYPPEEAQSLVNLMDARGLDTIFLLSPTTLDARLAQVGKLGRGYLYYVSLKGVTGAGNIDTADVAQRVNHIKQFTSLPVGVGFGIRDAASAKAVAQVADAVVIGSRLVQEIIDAGNEAPARIEALLAGIRKAMDGAA